jgi:HEAT repeat protein
LCSDHPRVRCGALLTLSRASAIDTETIQILIEMLTDSSGTIRQTAANTLVSLGQNWTTTVWPVEALRAGLQNANPIIRRECTSALGAIGFKEPRPHLSC